MPSMPPPLKSSLHASNHSLGVVRWSARTLRTVKHASWGPPGTRRPRPGLGLAKGRHTPIVAVAAPESPTRLEKTFKLNSGDIVQISTDVSSQEQSIHLSTNHESPNLILHWGVEGGQGYKGGWRLPAKDYWPERTVKYKKRALQTSWRPAENQQEISILLKNEEISDAINFVLKDEKSGVWYDNNGSNFTMALRQQTPTPPVVDVTLSQELCGVWAYLNWELAGCPNRSQEEADAEYRAGIKELEGFLRGGTSLEEIKRVVDAEVTIADFKKSKRAELKPIPQENVVTQEKPIVKEVQVEEEPVVEETVEDAVLGESLGTARRNFLDLIKAPELSVEKREKQAKPLDSIVQNAAVNESTKWRRMFPLGSNSELFVVVSQEAENGAYTVTITTDLQFPVVLHWGITKQGKGRSWHIPPADMIPSASRPYDDGKAAETSVLECDDEECNLELIESEVPLQRTKIEVPAGCGIAGIQFVLRSDDKTRWWKDGNGDFAVPIPEIGGKPTEETADSSTISDELIRTIISAEVNKDHWTLMHRFHKAADLIEAVIRGSYDEIEVADAMARIYCWLRYSSSRQLTWQRNYNTKPRELSHSQDRLTNAIGNAHGATSGEAQEWVRLMLGTVGRGGDGQRIRDEILHIMHRNKIKEMKGHWMEEWHQKLHNNTTPDDVPICEAYIAFMESFGDLSVYWRKLSDAGITKQRLEGFDRPIVTEPEYYADKHDGLLKDMYNYLGILKAVHSGADIQASATAAQNIIPGSAQGHLGYVLSHLGHPEILPFVEAAVEARMGLSSAMTGNLNLLYLDLALENQIRQAAERGAGISGPAAAGLVSPLLQNLCLSAGDNEEICFCLQSWEGLPKSVRLGYPNQEEALQAVSIIDRIRRALSTISDSVFTRIGEVSEAMGTAFECEKWAVDIFSEEVIRGGPAFAVSLVLGNVESAFRGLANLGAWQVISPSPVIGRIVSVSGLQEVQDVIYKEPTILMADRVCGEEEIPDGVVGVLTPDAPDVLAHVSVRARNMNVLFATCHDKWQLKNIQENESQVLSFKPTASGEVRWEKASAEKLASQTSGGDNHVPRDNLKLAAPKWPGKWVVAMDDYSPDSVGAKSRNIAGLRQKIPEWIQLPSSVTIPFGTFEKVLNMAQNKDIKLTILESLKKVSDGPSKALRICRDTAMQIVIPDELKQDLEAAMKSADIPPPQSPERWEKALEALRGVWASKFNDRAYYSMRKIGLSLDNLRMAVLVQRIVSPSYAFVIHTKNPSTGNSNEIYCELVKGLGESLVSGMVPGSSMAFTGDKSDLSNPKVLLYPSKSSGMYVPESLIFRSDSNGEDLDGYAGAGLYESITMDQSSLQTVDYVADRIMQDEEYRKSLLSRICEVGLAIEQALGSAQDIEGVIGNDGKITVVQTRPQV